MLSLVLASVQSILQVMTVVFFGFMLTRTGHFTVERQRWLAKINMDFFTPCLLFSNIASVISFQQLVAFWLIPVFFAAFVGLSFGVAQLSIRLFRVDKYYARFVTACIMFCNTNSLPIAVISSLAVSEAGKMLYWNADDTQEEVAARGISYTLMFGLFCNLMRWSYGYQLLQPTQEGRAVLLDQNYPVHQPSYYGSIESGQPDDYQVLPGSPTFSDHHSNDSTSMCSEPNPAQYIPSSHDPHHDSSLTLTSSNSQSISNTKSQHDDAALLSFPTLPDEEAMLTPVSRNPPTMAAWSWGDLAQTVFQCMTPPLYAALFGLFVGIIPPLKYLFCSPQSFLYPIVTKGIESCGRAAVPLILISLGSQLMLFHQKQLIPTPVTIKPITVAVLGRMVLVPLVIIPVMTAFVRYCSNSSTIAGDPVFIVAMTIVCCTPPAISLSQITQVSGVYEEELMSVFFWSYGVICVPVYTLIVFMALYIVNSLM